MAELGGRDLRARGVALALPFLACLATAAPASSAFTPVFDSSRGDLQIFADTAPDSVTVTCGSGFVLVNGGPVGIAGTQNYATCAAVRSVQINTGGGDDAVDTTGVSAVAGFTSAERDPASGDKVVTVATAEGDDRFVDGPADVLFDGGPGNDVADTGPGSDSLSGNLAALRPPLGSGGDPSGEDELDGGDGPDLIFGGVRNDVLNGGNGNDNVSGFAGRDRLKGGNGRDDMFGGSGGDELFGGSKNDDLRGNGGNDSADGDQGRDRCRAERTRSCEE